MAKIYKIEKPTISVGFYYICFAKLNVNVMGEIPKQFSEEFIQLHLSNLPDAKTYEFDKIERQVFEGFDRHAEQRPAYVSTLYLVFVKNGNRDGWELAGYHY